MRKRYGKFYADWRDEHGKRHMKACKSKTAAVHLSTKMQNQTAAKKDQPSGTSARSAGRVAKASRPGTRPTKSAAKSKARRAISNRAS
jgi:hypothetical protein